MNKEHNVLCPICGRIDKTEFEMSHIELKDMGWYWLRTEDGVVAYCHDCADQVLRTYLMVHELLKKG